MDTDLKEKYLSLENLDVIVSEFKSLLSKNSVGKKTKTDGEIFNNYNSDSPNIAGEKAHAEGMSTQANGKYSHAEGQLTLADSDCAHAEGQNTHANGVYSHAEGFKTLSQGEAAHAEGVGAQAKGRYSHAEGQLTLADSDCAHAEGYNSKASNAAAHAEGYQTLSFGHSSHTEGYQTTTINQAEHAEGKYNVSHKGQTISSIGIGESGSKRKNAVEVLNNGSVYITGIGDYIGKELKNVKSLQEVVNSKVDNSDLVGKKTAKGGEIFNDYGSNIASNQFAHAEGENTYANGYASHTEGYLTQTTNIGEHAEGANNISHSGKTISSIGIGTDPDVRKNAVEVLNNGLVYINGIGYYDGTNLENTKSLQEVVNSKADGSDLVGSTTIDGGEIFNDYLDNNAYAEFSHAEGSGNTINEFGNNSHAEGISNEIFAENSHAEGNNNIINELAYNSHVEGNDNTVTNQAEHAEGRFNVSNNFKFTSEIGTPPKQFKTISSIGIGDSNSNRKNAFEVLDNGEIYINGLGEYAGRLQVDVGGGHFNYNPGIESLQTVVNSKLDEYQLRDYLQNHLNDVMHIKEYDVSSLCKKISPQFTSVELLYDDIQSAFKQQSSNGLDIPHIYNIPITTISDTTYNGYQTEGQFTFIKYDFENINTDKCQGGVIWWKFGYWEYHLTILAGKKPTGKLTAINNSIKQGKTLESTK